MTPTRLRLFVLFAVVSAAVFVRLGIWQLHRLGERRARNTVISDRLREAERDAGSLAFTDTTGIRFRRVRVTG
ncbi:MAG TPA: SURF1 family cytochrome oxidase biogenesis protein, partial [Gemmatimonadaceae bacterium]|nr:SURF1 family cytochrome oxidase biogenesis protein [Gemmatimonadaceae bacterium]